MNVMKLLPCAHCGSPAEEVNDARYGWYVVACMNEDCGITMSEVGIESQAEANAIWNRRAEIAERDEMKLALRDLADAFADYGGPTYSNVYKNAVKALGWDAATKECGHVTR